MKLETNCLSLKKIIALQGLEAYSEKKSAEKLGGQAFHKIPVWGIIFCMPNVAFKCVHSSSPSKPNVNLLSSPIPLKNRYILGSCCT